MKAGYYILVKKDASLMVCSWAKEVGLANLNRDRLQAVNISWASYCGHLLYTSSSADREQRKALSSFHGSEVSVFHVIMPMSTAHIHSVLSPFPLGV